MNLKKIYFNSVLVFFLLTIFLIVKFLFEVEYAYIFYLSNTLFFLFTIIVFRNIYLLFNLIRKENDSYTFIPALASHFMFIGFFEFFIFVMIIYPFDKFFLFHGFISCLFVFLFYKSIKYMHFNKILYMLILKVLIPFTVRVKKFKNITFKKFKLDQHKKIKNDQFNKSQKYIYEDFLFCSVAYMIFPPLFYIFKLTKFSLLSVTYLLNYNLLYLWFY